MTTSRRALLGCVIAVYFFAVGAVVGALIERVRFDRQRAIVLARYDTLSSRLHSHLMALEASAPSSGARSVRVAPATDRPDPAAGKSPGQRPDHVHE